MRLCVETKRTQQSDSFKHAAAAFVRLCVETSILKYVIVQCNGSRLRAAVC